MMDKISDVTRQDIISRLDGVRIQLKIEDNLITCIIVSHFAQELYKRYVKNDKLKFCAAIDKE
ncbi:MAG: hypothetical protein EGR85_07760 [Subdoligranulum sp.]|nr:hypothetical protein [Subdoligranulum sp.]